jgi:hypothetical protein
MKGLSQNPNDKKKVAEFIVFQFGVRVEAESREQLHEIVDKIACIKEVSSIPLIGLHIIERVDETPLEPKTT